jgi:hypothetical protein
LFPTLLLMSMPVVGIIPVSLATGFINPRDCRNLNVSGSSSQFVSLPGGVG